MQNYLKTNIKSKQNRIIMLAVLICVITAVFFAEAFILTHANHEHNHNGVGGGCTVCTQINNTENLLKQLGLTVAIISFGFIGLFVAVKFIYFILSLIRSYTLINLKIRMNN